MIDKGPDPSAPRFTPEEVARTGAAHSEHVEPLVSLLKEQDKGCASASNTARCRADAVHLRGHAGWGRWRKTPWSSSTSAIASDFHNIVVRWKASRRGGDAGPPYRMMG